MNYTEYEMTDGKPVLDGKGQPVKLEFEERLRLIELDLDELTLPAELPDALAIMRYIRDTQVVGNNLRKLKRSVTESLREWELAVERMQRSVGSYDKLCDLEGKRFSDTGVIRKDLRSLVTATWGPARHTSRNPSAAGIGLKRGLLPIEEEAGRQLTRFILPAEGAVPDVVDFSFDDVIERKSAHKRRIEGMEKDLESRHYDVNNVVKMLEIQAYEVRRAVPVKE